MLFIAAQLFQDLGLWDGVAYSTYDAIGWGCSTGWIPSTLRASLFEATYFGLTLMLGPGWQYRNKRNKALRYVLTVIDDGAQGITAFALALFLWYHQVYGDVITRGCVSTGLILFGGLQTSWACQA